MLKVTKIATLHRMVMADKTCPHGLKSKALLERQGFKVDDNHLNSRAEIDFFKAEYGVTSTPQTFIDGVRVGGFDELSSYFGKAPTRNNVTTYKPVISLFVVAALMASIISWLLLGTMLSAKKF